MQRRNPIGEVGATRHVRRNPGRCRRRLLGVRESNALSQSRFKQLWKEKREEWNF